MRPLISGRTETWSAGPDVTGGADGELDVASSTMAVVGRVCFWVSSLLPGAFFQMK